MQEPAVVKKFRAIGTAEGISFLVLLGVAMPLKYMMDMPKAVTYVGWVHGILFVWYCYMVIEAGQALKWKFGRIFLAFLASLLPFGPFLFDRWFLRKKHFLPSFAFAYSSDQLQGFTIPCFLRNLFISKRSHSPSPFHYAQLYAPFGRKSIYLGENTLKLFRFQANRYL